MGRRDGGRARGAPHRHRTGTGPAPDRRRQVS